MFHHLSEHMRSDVAENSWDVGAWVSSLLLDDPPGRAFNPVLVLSVNLIRAPMSSLQAPSGSAGAAGY